MQVINCISREKSRLYIFDFIRAAAVLFVLIGHYLCEHHNYAKSSPIWIKFHGVGVGMFFFISGYLIFMTLTKSNKKNFLFQRYFRLVPSLLVALVLLGLLQHVVELKYYFFGLFFIGDFFNYPNVLGVDMWTLHTETRFYILLYVIYFFFLKANLKSRLRLLLNYIFSLAIVLSVTAYFNKINPGFHFSDPKWNIFCILYLYFGIFVYLYNENFINLRELIIVTFAHLLIIGYFRHIFFMIAPASSFKDNYLVGAAVSMFFLAIKSRIPYSKVVALIAFISYPLYLTHHPLINKWGLVSIIPIFIASYLISIFVEHPIMAWAKRRS